jgi:hypothetical protein
MASEEMNTTYLIQTGELLSGKKCNWMAKDLCPFVGWANWSYQGSETTKALTYHLSTYIHKRPPPKHPYLTK